MKAQMTVEFLIVFAIWMSVLIIIAQSLLIAQNRAVEKISDFSSFLAVEGAARAIETSTNNGGVAVFDFYDENVSYSIEGNSLQIFHNGKVIEVRGVFTYDKTEPV